MRQAIRRLRSLVGPQSWARYQRTYVLAALAALVETASIAAVFPIVAGIAAGQGGADAPWFTLQGALLVMAGLYVGGLCLRALALHQSARTNMTEGYGFAAGLFARSLEQPFVWNLAHHSADLRAMILSDAQDLITSLFAPLGRLIAQVTLVVAVACVLLVLQPLATVVFATAIIGIYVLTFALLRRPLQRDGEAQMAAHAQRHRLSAEAFQAGREVQLSPHLQVRFAADFAVASGDLAQAATNRSIYTELPKLLLEAMIFGVLAWVALQTAAQPGVVVAGTLPTMVLFAAAGLKLFPMGHLVFTNLALMRAGWPIVTRFEGLLAGLQAAKGTERCAAIRSDVVLEKVGFHYPGASQPALRDVSLTARRGEKVAIIGPSGVGKSTLIDVIAGLLVPNEGRVLVDGAALSPSQIRDWQSQLRYCPQVPALFDQSILDNITLGVDYPAEQVAAAVHLACLDTTVAGKADALQTRVGEQGRHLSGGQIKRISIARALLDDVAVYLMDEPTSNLDANTAQMVMTRVFAARPDAIFFIVTHDLALAKTCDTIVDLGR